VWKDYLEKDNEQIVKWNPRTRETCQKEICSIAVAIKQGVLEDFWFKPYIGKFSGEKFTKEYVHKRHASWSTTLNK
jgi:hypothetical protein